MISHVHHSDFTVISILPHYPFFSKLFKHKYLTPWHFIHLLDKDIFLKNHDTRIPPIKLIILQWHLLSSFYSHVPSCLKMSFYLGFVWIRDHTSPYITFGCSGSFYYTAVHFAFYPCHWLVKETSFSR